jgi:hypothetical protein
VRSRLALLVVVGALLAGMVVLARSPVEPARPSAAATVVGPVLAPPAAPGPVWMCAAGTAATPTPAVHEVVVANPTDETISVTMSEFGAPDTEPTTSTAEVPARSVSVLTPATSAAVTVEATRTGVVVSHRLSAEGLTDEAPCATSASGEWYFPGADTRTQLGSVAQLHLFNPFPTDVSLDVTVVSADGVRVPTALNGMVVAGRSVKVVNLGEIVQRRDQFAMAVATRPGAGKLVAELTQITAAPDGLRLTPGADRRSTQLVFADGQTGAGLSERYVVFNPGQTPAAVLIAVVPHAVDRDLLPEPFELEVPARRFVVVDLSEETRVPLDVPHWVQVESLGGRGIAAQRLVAVTAAGNPYGVNSGTAGSTGASAGATRWVVPWADRSPNAVSALSLVNPSRDTIARVEIRAFGGGVLDEGDAVREVELAPGGGAAVDLGASGEVPRGLVVSSSAPVLVERRLAGSSKVDIEVIPGVPDGRGLARLPRWVP